MNIIENISEEELTSVVTKLFERVDALDASVIDASTKADTAITLAKAAKEGLKSVKTAPTNGWDVINHGMDSIVNALGVLGTVAFLGVFVWFGYKLVCASDPMFAEQEHIRAMERKAKREEAKTKED